MILIILRFVDDIRELRGANICLGSTRLTREQSSDGKAMTRRGARRRRSVRRDDALSTSSSGRRRLFPSTVPLFRTSTGSNMLFRSGGLKNNSLAFSLFLSPAHILTVRRTKIRASEERQEDVAQDDQLCRSTYK